MPSIEALWQTGQKGFIKPTFERQLEQIYLSPFPQPKQFLGKIKSKMFTAGLYQHFKNCGLDEKKYVWYCDQMRQLSEKFLSLVLGSALLLLIPVVVFASHSWNGYHWARTANPFTLKLGDNMSSSWAPYLVTTSSDWSLSSVLDTLIVPGQGRKNCRATLGRVEVCNKTYGSNGWLGIAQIWVSGSHIYQGVTKMNDTYFNTPSYNTPAWKNLVLCQEVGHTLGLDHQDVNFNNPPLGTCMDYTNDPTPNQHPNAHDYEELAIIYAHLDSTTTVGQSITSQGASEHALRGNAPDDPKEFGEKIKDNGKVALYAKDLGNQEKLFTFVVWAK